MTAPLAARVEATAPPDPSGDQEVDAPLVRPHVPALVVVVALQVVGALAGLAPLLAVVELARMLLGPGPVDHGRAWTLVMLGVVGLLVRLLLTGVSSGLGHLLDARVQLALRRRLASHLARTPMGWLSRRSTGELTKLVGDDVAAVHPFIAHTPGMLASAVVVPLASLVYLLAVSWQMTLVTLVPVACAIAVVPLFMTPARVHEQEDFDAAMNRLSSVALEFVQGIAVAKSLSGTHRAPRRFVTATDRFVDTFRRWVVGMSAPAAAMQLALSPPFVILVILVGGTVLIGRNSLAPADLLPFLLLGLGLTAPVAALGHGFDGLQAARAAVGRIRGTLGVQSLPEAVRPRSPQGHRVELRDVCFAYDEREVLRGIDLDLAPGTTTAVVGPSGSGKSTLVHLLPRFFDPTYGSVRIGGVDLRDIATEELYRSVSFVFQDVRLLRTSVADNIALAVPGASHDDLVRAARLAQIHDRIVALPRGYASIVGDDARLSGGEAQRLALARALLADTPVIVLDEATSFADPQTERAVQEALTAWRGDRTLLLVAHRPDTAAGADTVVVLDSGAIVERGDPNALLTRGGALAALWASSDRARPVTDTPQSEGDSR